MFFLRLLSRLPLRFLYGISSFLFLITFYVIKYRRQLVQKNLANSFPEKTEMERKRIEKDFYRNLCDYSVESLKLLTISKEELRKRMIFKNPEVVLKYLANGQSVWQFASHQFNWEWLLAAGSFAFPGGTDFVYQPVHSKFFNDLTNTARTRFGAYAIKRDEIARQIIKRKDKVRGISLVADQYPGYRRDKKYETTFLNQPTVFFSGANHIALLTQYPVIFYEVRKIKRGYYEATAVEVGTPPYPKDSHTIIDNYIKALEMVICEYPAGWLWSHNRWKTRHLKQASTQYPPSSVVS